MLIVVRHRLGAGLHESEARAPFAVYNLRVKFNGALMLMFHRTATQPTLKRTTQCNGLWAPRISLGSGMLR